MGEARMKKAIPVLIFLVLAVVMGNFFLGPSFLNRVFEDTTQKITPNLSSFQVKPSLLIGFFLALLCIGKGIQIAIKAEEKKTSTFLQVFGLFSAGFIILAISAESIPIKTELGLFLYNLNLSISRFYTTLFRNLIGWNLTEFFGNVRDIFLELILLVGLVVGYFAQK